MDKLCGRCKITKNVADFHQDPRYKMGVSGFCKACKNELSVLHGKRMASKNRGLDLRLREKACSRCKIVKKRDEFSSCPSKKGGLSSRCKECRRLTETTIKRKAENPRWSIGKRLEFHGITLADYDAMLIAQSGRCALCEIPMRMPCVDHCHKTFVVRAILCNHCNHMLAGIEDEEFLKRALTYVRRYKKVA